MPELRLDNSIIDDRYLVDHCLGRGSYAEIFLAFDQARNDEPVIIKALNMTLQGTPDPELEQTLVENFQNEAIALDQVRHPNIIRRLGHGTAADLNGTPFHYLLLEYMPGGDLLGYCRRHLFSLDEALFYFQQVAEALAYAHSQAVIHRDIKPNNLLLSGDKTVVKITDFGVAKLGHDDTQEITRVGTNIYAPPEHHPDATDEEQKEKLTPSADVYSLAKTIYTAMTGRAPRQFSREAIAELPDHLANAAWGAALLSVLKKATATRVADRYQTVQEFWEDFARLNQLSPADAEDEATLVSRRLTGTSTVERAAAQPNFQTMSGALDRNRPQKARIVVDLPQRVVQKREPPEPADTAAREAINGNGSASSHSRVALAPPNEGLPHEQGRGEQFVVANGAQAGVQTGVVDPLRAREKAAADLVNRRLRESREAGQSFFDNLRAAINSDWLRRMFIVLLIVALVGLAASTYYYFAEKKGSLLGFIHSSDKDGQILNPNGALTNLRSDSSANASVLGTMQNGTRVRVVEDRGRWIHVKILSWVGSPPSNAPEDGWVDSRFVKLD